MKPLVPIAIVAVLCGCDQQGRLSQQEIAMIEAKVNAQMKAFDDLLVKNNVELNYFSPPLTESIGNSHDLRFLIGKQLDDWPEFLAVLDGPMETRPDGICFRQGDADDSLVFYTCETNATRMAKEMAPSDRLELAVRDGEIVDYCFTPYYTH